MTTALVLGAGVSGSAFTLPLADAGTTVRLVGTHLDVELIDGLRATRCSQAAEAPPPEAVETFITTSWPVPSTTASSWSCWVSARPGSHGRSTDCARCSRRSGRSCS
ncbi:MAG: hypothetical protein R3D25_00050 [Geminicoccaceae bacterium]